MATVTGATAAHVQAIDDAGIADAGIESDGHLRLTRNDASQIDAGSIQSPAGAVLMFAGASVPSGWLLCNGQAVSRTTYANLFAAIGTTFGTGDGSTTFNVPNFETKIPRMQAASMGGTGGSSTHTHTTAHDHQIDGGSTAAHAQIVIPSSASPVFGRINRISVPSWTETNELQISANGSTTTGSTASTNGAAVKGQTSQTTPTSSATSTLPPYLNINFIIKAS